MSYPSTGTNTHTLLARLSVRLDLFSQKGIKEDLWIQWKTVYLQRKQWFHFPSYSYSPHKLFIKSNSSDLLPFAAPLTPRCWRSSRSPWSATSPSAPRSTSSPSQTSRGPPSSASSAGPSPSPPQSHTSPSQSKKVVKRYFCIQWCTKSYHWLSFEICLYFLIYSSYITVLIALIGWLLVFFYLTCLESTTSISRMGLESLSPSQPIVPW